MTTSNQAVKTRGTPIQESDLVFFATPVVQYSQRHVQSCEIVGFGVFFSLCEDAMLLLIFQIIGVVLVTARVVDELEAKGRKTLLFKFLTPIGWFGGQLAGALIGTVILALGGTDIDSLSRPMADTEMSNELFFLLLAQVVGTIVGVGAVYLVARRLPFVETDAATPSAGPG